MNQHELSSKDLPEWFELIKTSREDYIKIYEKSQRRESGFVFNWSAALLGMIWTLYRKMYRVSFVLFVVSLTLEAVGWYFSNNNIINIIILANLIFGIFSNTLYFKHLEKKHSEGFRPSFYKDVWNWIINALIITIVLMLIGILCIYFGFIAYDIRQGFPTLDDVERKVEFAIIIYGYMVELIVWFVAYVQYRHDKKALMKEKALYIKLK